jgi:hypothetical protein
MYFSKAWNKYSQISAVIFFIVNHWGSSSVILTSLPILEGRYWEELGNNGNLTVWKENYNWWCGSIGGTFEGGFTVYHHCVKYLMVS